MTQKVSKYIWSHDMLSCAEIICGCGVYHCVYISDMRNSGFIGPSVPRVLIDILPEYFFVDGASWQWIQYVLQLIVSTCSYVILDYTRVPIESILRADVEVLIDSQPIGSSTEEEEMLAYVSRQVDQKWSMLARYAGLEEDDIQEIKRVPAEDRSCVTLKKIQGRLTWNELLNIVHKHVSSSSQVLHT